MFEDEEREYFSKKRREPDVDHWGVGFGGERWGGATGLGGPPVVMFQGVPVDCWLGLARDVLVQAFKDLRSAEHGKEAAAWLYGGQADHIMTVLGFEPENVGAAIDRVLEGGVKWRGYY